MSAILKQNPRFTAGMTSPVSGIFRAMENATSGHQETGVFLSDRQRDVMLRGIVATYYDDPTEVVFDTSRMWSARIPVLARLFPEAKIIACVREIGWILDSFEALYRRNGMRPSAIYDWDTSGTVYSRMSALAGPGGVVGYAINALQEGVASAESAGRLMLIDYDALCQEPEWMLRAVYEFVEELWFEHDFANVAYEAGEFDKALGAEGLHTVKGGVRWQPRKTILPQGLFDQYNGPNFWKNA